MAIFDIIEDVSKKRMEKTDTGDSRIMGVMLGKVVKNYDKDMPGRVSVILLSREQGEGEGDEADSTRILWARVVMPSAGGSCADLEYGACGRSTGKRRIAFG